LYNRHLQALSRQPTIESVNYIHGTGRPPTGSCADKNVAAVLQSFPFRLRVAGDFLESHLKQYQNSKAKNAK
jgi:hypothetical protein